MSNGIEKMKSPSTMHSAVEFTLKINEGGRVDGVLKIEDKIRGDKMYEVQVDAWRARNSVEITLFKQSILDDKSAKPLSKFRSLLSQIPQTVTDPSSLKEKVNYSPVQVEFEARVSKGEKPSVELLHIGKTKGLEGTHLNLDLLKTNLEKAINENIEVRDFIIEKLGENLKIQH